MYIFMKKKKIFIQEEMTKLKVTKLKKELNKKKRKEEEKKNEEEIACL